MRSTVPPTIPLLFSYFPSLNSHLILVGKYKNPISIECFNLFCSSLYIIDTTLVLEIVHFSDSLCWSFLFFIFYFYSFVDIKLFFLFIFYLPFIFWLLSIDHSNVDINCSNSILKGKFIQRLHLWIWKFLAHKGIKIVNNHLLFEYFAQFLINILQHRQL